MCQCSIACWWILTPTIIRSKAESILLGVCVRSTTKSGIPMCPLVRVRMREKYSYIIYTSQYFSMTFPMLIHHISRYLSDISHANTTFCLNYTDNFSNCDNCSTHHKDCASMESGKISHTKIADYVNNIRAHLIHQLVVLLWDRFCWQQSSFIWQLLRYDVYGRFNCLIARY